MVQPKREESSELEDGSSDDSESFDELEDDSESFDKSEDNGQARGGEEGSKFKDESDDDRQVPEMLQCSLMKKVAARAAPPRRHRRPSNKSNARAAHVASETSSAEIPMPGTRASAHKKRLERELLGVPYQAMEVSRRLLK